ncbi:hypothetical protein BAUCODRAFT_102599 [Baudoinia panamericana UAMH 10762]|uniref:AAA+ ATPase domain-containing protein n=1 Tax=Baudoinia panamericana (strain UAMH 10762) TaxID=717646 RepID=M2NLZ3_BAUPA|nr:uncharacterized protein BAUCODRAFT_102599 [Baudoinia panamericana UAMH 10762]EMD00191.1 hypothetical protein BAUCODRAFT_102599 [Baudoinia panamericana UAMH 10762]
MFRAPPATSMQKTYDECYLICSTAIYFEGQNNEAEALRSWRNALDHIYYHNAYKMPASYVPRTETERALADSLRKMELQCKERVDLLEALKKSRQDAEQDANGSAATATPVASPPPQHTSAGTDKFGSTATAGNQWLGADTVAPTSYTDLPRPSPTPERRPPPHPPRPTYTSKRSSDFDSPRTMSLQSTTSLTPPHNQQPRARTPSPEKKSGMLRTLRPTAKDRPPSGSNMARTMRSRPPPAAAKAATQVWTGTKKPQTPSQERRPLDNATSWDPYTRSLVEKPSEPPHLTSDTDRRRSEMSIIRPPSPSDFLHPPPYPDYPSARSSPFEPLSRSQDAMAERQKLDNNEAQLSQRMNDVAVSTNGKASHKPDSRHDSTQKTLINWRTSNPQMTPPSSDESDKDAEPSSNEPADADEEWDRRIQHILTHLPKGVDEAAAKQILTEIVIKGDEVHWDDVAGLEIAKSALKETVVYPFLRPDLFMGLREPARGMLLFGPPGTGKTMLARAVATESKSVFFAISASSLTSKYLGESEKLVRALFTLAKALAPSIIFVDEIDSLLGSRGGSSEHEATRRIKTEFLIQWSDLQKAAAGREDTSKVSGDATRVLVLAATNLPWAIDEAARRRFVRRQYIPLPEDWVREKQLRNLLSAQKHNLSDRDLKRLVQLTDGFSGSDITALAKDAAMGPLRSLGERLLHMSPDDIRPIGMGDFESSLGNIRPSVSKGGLREFEEWAREFGERGG